MVKYRSVWDGRFSLKHELRPESDAVIPSGLGDKHRNTNVGFTIVGLFTNYFEICLARETSLIQGSESQKLECNLWPPQYSEVVKCSLVKCSEV